MNRTLHSTANVKNAVLGLGVASTKQGEVIDRSNYRDAIVHLLVDNVTGSPTSAEVTVKVQHADTEDSADFVDADIEGIQSTFTVEGEGEGELHINLDGFKQYIRVVANTSFQGGTSPKADVVGTVVLGNKVANPVRG